jgi:AcrR family transcriptional regulator
LVAHKHDESPSQEEQNRRLERAERILDVAAELVQRWGYKKTTIDDIARQARVAKGTVYLHWKSREELFISLITREKINEAQRFKEAIAQEPEGITLPNMIKHSLLAGLRNPLLRAIILQDSEMLGDLVHHPATTHNIEQQLALFGTLLDYQREQGMIRSDLLMDEQIYIIETISIGFLMVDQFLPAKFQLSIERKADLLADMLRHTFETRILTTDEKQQLNQHFQQMVQQSNENWQEHINSVTN